MLRSARSPRTRLAPCWPRPGGHGMTESSRSLLQGVTQARKNPLRHLWQDWMASMPCFRGKAIATIFILHAEQPWWAVFAQW